MAADDETITHKKTRILSVIAAAAVALACGTNYAYSAWAPQFADKLQLSVTQSNIIGTTGNLGMYAAGVPVGMVTDKKGPRLTALLGTIALFAGYYPIKRAYDKGPGYMGVASVSFCSFLTGVGSCAAFQSALKTATLNWPTHRGSASAFPLAGFGLSAFFYTLIAGIAFPANTSGLLMMLAMGTSLLVLVSLPFLIVVDHKTGDGYAALPTNERLRRKSNALGRTKSNANKFRTSSHRNSQSDEVYTGIREQEEHGEVDGPSAEDASLLSEPGDIMNHGDDITSSKPAHSRIGSSVLGLLCKQEFWQLWILLGLLAGVGLMTINNIGHDAQALWIHWDKSVSKEFIERRQLLHVSIISICNFLGRLASGIGSDVIVRRLHHSRFWCIVLSGCIFTVGQLSGIEIENPSFLWVVSGFNGLAYGVLFGVFPALVVDAFGPDGFAANWGSMTLAPVISGNIFNLVYGASYDSHSNAESDGLQSCELGLRCYRTAYYFTLTSSVLGIVACFWGMRAEQTRARSKLEDCEDRDS